MPIQCQPKWRCQQKNCWCNRSHCIRCKRWKNKHMQVHVSAERKTTMISWVWRGWVTYVPQLWVCATFSRQCADDCGTWREAASFRRRRCTIDCLRRTCVRQQFVALDPPIRTRPKRGWSIHKTRVSVVHIITTTCMYIQACLIWKWMLPCDVSKVVRGNYDWSGGWEVFGDLTGCDLRRNLFHNNNTWRCNKTTFRNASLEDDINASNKTTHRCVN